MNKIIDHWYWGRLNIGSYKTIFVTMRSTKKYGSSLLPLFCFAENDKILTGDGTYLKQENSNFIQHLGGRSYPEDIKYTWQKDCDSINIHLKNPQVLEDRSLLSQLPFLKKKIARLMMNPYYFRFNAETKIDVNFNKKENSIQDKGLYEIMMLK